MWYYIIMHQVLIYFIYDLTPVYVTIYVTVSLVEYKEDL